MDEQTTILDWEGNEVKIGVMVRYFENSPEDAGEVIEISDWDGDVDDDTGRSIVHEPSIKVRWADGTEQEYNTGEWTFREFGMVMTADGPEPEGVECTGKVEELMVIPKVREV